MPKRITITEDAEGATVARWDYLEAFIKDFTGTHQLVSADLNIEVDDEADPQEISITLPAQEAEIFLSQVMTTGFKAKRVKTIKTKSELSWNDDEDEGEQKDAG